MKLHKFKFLNIFFELLNWRTNKIPIVYIASACCVCTFCFSLTVPISLTNSTHTNQSCSRIRSTKKDDISMRIKNKMWTTWSPPWPRLPTEWKSRFSSIFFRLSRRPVVCFASQNNLQTYRSPRTSEKRVNCRRYMIEDALHKWICLHTNRGVSTNSKLIRLEANCLMN